MRMSGENGHSPQVSRQNVRPGQSAEQVDTALGWGNRHLTEDYFYIHIYFFFSFTFTIFSFFFFSSSLKNKNKNKCFLKSFYRSVYLKEQE